MLMIQSTELYLFVGALIGLAIGCIPQALMLINLEFRDEVKNLGPKELRFILFIGCMFLWGLMALFAIQEYLKNRR